MKYIILISLFLSCGIASAVPVSKQFSISQQIAVSSTTTSTRALKLNSSRGYLLIQNQGTDAVFVKVGSTISGSEGISIGAGASYEFVGAPIDEVWVKANSGTQPVIFLEGLIQ